MNRVWLEDLGRLTLRLAIGGMMLLHGLNKLSHGVTGIANKLAARGVPTFVSLGVYVGEVLAPMLLLIGIATRPSGAVLAFNMVIAIWMSHMADITRRAATGGWGIEVPMLYMLGGIAIACLGAGRFSLSRGKGRFD